MADFATCAADSQVRHAAYCVIAHIWRNFATMTTAQIDGTIPSWHIGDRLRKAREQAGLDQQQLADLIGVSRRTVGNAESGKHGVRKIVLNQWSLATGVPRAWLETGETPNPGDPGGGSQNSRTPVYNIARWRPQLVAA